MPLPIMMDVDTGVDDAVALLLAIASRDEIDLLAITTVSGNVPVKQTTKNTLALLALADRNDIPVAMGQEKPLLIPLVTAAAVHGEDGLGGAALPSPQATPVAESAVHLMRRVLEESNEPVTLVPLGPLTNIALLLRAYPHVKEKIRQIVLMGGGAYRGNSTVVAEFNIFVDPEAAHIVFSSGLPIVMAGLDMTMKAFIKPEDIEKFASLGTKASMFCAEVFRFYAKAYQRYEELDGACAVHDATTITYLLHPEWFESEEAYVKVDIDGKLTYGCTVTDLRPGTLRNHGNVRVLLDVEREKFVQLLLDRICRVA